MPCPFYNKPRYLLLTLGLISKRTISTAAVPRFTTPVTRRGSLVPPDAVEEEALPHYNAKDFFPVQPGRIFRGKYETITKLGYGGGSTVWLARELNLTRSSSQRQPSGSDPYVVLKFCTSDYINQEAAQHELRIGERLGNANSLHAGAPLVLAVLDSFEVTGPNGTHNCLVFEPMRETMSLFQSRLKQKRLTLDLLQNYLVCMLNALDYIHSECRVIHADLSLQNILVNFEGGSVLEEFVQAQAKNPMVRKQRDGYSTYQSHNQFGPLQPRLGPIVPVIADFGHAHWIADAEPKINPIQPDSYRAPEVILGTGWSYSADIWNLGVLLWNMLEGREVDLFSNIHSSDGKYLAQNHLARMIALLGPPPKELLQRELEMRRWNFSPAVTNDDQTLCHKAHQYYKGPFFDNEGTFLHLDLIPDLNLEDTITALEGDEKRGFMDFVVNNMLCWLPEQRKTAKELLKHPWLKDARLPW